MFVYLPTRIGLWLVFWRAIWAYLPTRYGLGSPAADPFRLPLDLADFPDFGLGTDFGSRGARPGRPIVTILWSLSSVWMRLASRASLRVFHFRLVLYVTDSAGSSSIGSGLSSSSDYGIWLTLIPNVCMFFCCASKLLMILSRSANIWSLLPVLSSAVPAVRSLWTKWGVCRAYCSAGTNGERRFISAAYTAILVEAVAFFIKAVISSIYIFLLDCMD